MSQSVNSSSQSHVIDISNPFYLGSSDNPSNALVSNPPNNSPLFANWSRVNSMVISWILNSLHRNIADSLIFLPTAYDIWKELNHRYEQADGAQIYQIQQQLYSLSQGSDDFSTYFTKLSKIWDELRLVQNIPSCTCAAATGIAKYLDEQRLIQLLMGLNDTYKVLRGQILMMKPLPNISTVYSMIVQEERQREITIPTNINHDTIAMNVSHNSSSNFSKKSLVCTHCKKTGHSKSQCYRLIGFPSNFKFTKTKKDEPKSVVQIATSDASSAISQE
ncbi:uncharacterized protein LOC111898673 [Lactuca sativa]|uniref:uncharacterized protein LOC111898673 n=1 Tax=Lactuca sativa TaxID=4236 RepID=UPI0022AFFCAB|nr:uncharacterized protein LOC111898673 [Lactuca sativa]